MLFADISQTTVEREIKTICIIDAETFFLKKED